MENEIRDLQDQISEQVSNQLRREQLLQQKINNLEQRMKTKDDIERAHETISNLIWFVGLFTFMIITLVKLFII